MTRTVRRGVELGTVNAGLWWFGWRPLVSVVVGAGAGLIVGNAVAIPVELLVGSHTLLTMGAFTAAGIVAGLLAYLAGTRAINGTYRDVVAAFERGTTDRDASVTTYALLGDGTGSTPLVEAHERYASTYLVLGPTSLTVSDGRLDLVGRTPSLEESLELPYDRIASVDDDGAALVIETTAGDDFRYETDGDPSAAIADLRDRI